MTLYVRLAPAAIGDHIIPFKMDNIGKISGKPMDTGNWYYYVLNEKVFLNSGISAMFNALEKYERKQVEISIETMAFSLTKNKKYTGIYDYSTSRLTTVYKNQ
jgi:hypothetical protein